MRLRMWITTERRSSMPWVWSACSCVRNAASMWSTLLSMSCSRRSGAVSMTMRVVPWPDTCSTISEQRRRRFFGFVGSQAPQPRAGRGTPAEEPQPRIVNVSVMRLPNSGFHLREQAEEVFGGLARNLIERNAARLREHFCDLDHIGRLVAFAAELAGRKVGRVCFNQNTVSRPLGCKRAQGLRLLEGQDAREADVEPKRHRLQCELAPAGVTMQHGAKRSLCRFLLQDAAAILVGLAGVDHQRQAGGTSRGNVGTKAPRLRLRRAVVVEIIEPGFTERDDLGMLRQRDQLVRRDAVLLIRVMRMGADRAIDVIIALSDREQVVQPPYPRRDRHHAADAGYTCTRHDPVEIFRKIWKIQMAVAIDQHRVRLRPPARCSAGKPASAPAASSRARCAWRRQAWRSCARPRGCRGYRAAIPRRSASPAGPGSRSGARPRR